MKKFTLFAGLAAVAVAVPAQAHQGAQGPKSHPPAQTKKHASAPHKCTPHAAGYNARGTLVSSSLTQTAGAATPKRGDDRYSGSLTVNVTKANHKAPTGEQTFTLTNAKVRFADADHNQVADQPKAGDRVKLHGKITRLAKHCDQTGFTPEITVRHVQFRAPAAPKPPKDES
jgi:hypothetical protein